MLPPADSDTNFLTFQLGSQLAPEMLSNGIIRNTPIWVCPIIVVEAFNIDLHQQLVRPKRGKYREVNSLLNTRHSGLAIHTCRRTPTTPL